MKEEVLTSTLWAVCPGKNRKISNVAQLLKDISLQGRQETPDQKAVFQTVHVSYNRAHSKYSRKCLFAFNILWWKKNSKQS